MTSNKEFLGAKNSSELGSKSKPFVNFFDTKMIFTKKLQNQSYQVSTGSQTFNKANEIY
jgi:hypothetical protein